MGGSVIGEGLMVRVNNDRVRRSMEQVPPFFKGPDDGEEFSIIDSIILFSRGERLG